MSKGTTRITALEPSPMDHSSTPEVASVQSFRSNHSDDHFVVGFNPGYETAEGSPMGYVDKRAAVDLAMHFIAVANELGADLYVSRWDEGRGGSTE